jgi:hypothetical protein
MGRIFPTRRREGRVLKSSGHCSPVNFAVDARGQHRGSISMGWCLRERGSWSGARSDSEGEMLDLLAQRTARPGCSGETDAQAAQEAT